MKTFFLKMILARLTRNSRILKVNHLVCNSKANHLSSSAIMSNKNAFIIDQALINGKWVKASSTFPVISPSNGQTFGEAAECDEQNLNDAVDAAKKAFKTWSILTAKERSVLIYKLYELQLKHKDDLAELITLEMGKPIAEAKGEIVYGASFLQWFSEQAKRINGEILQSPWPEKLVMYIKEPIGGPIAIITPVSDCQWVTSH